MCCRPWPHSSRVAGGRPHPYRAKTALWSWYLPKAGGRPVGTPSLVDRPTRTAHVPTSGAGTLTGVPDRCAHHGDALATAPTSLTRGSEGPEGGPMAFCTNCGNELGAGRFCTNCGQP